MSEPRYYFFETENIYGDTVSYILEEAFDFGEDTAVVIHNNTTSGKTQVMRTYLFRALFLRSVNTNHGWMSDSFIVAVQENLVDLLVPISKSESMLPAGFNFIDAHKVM